MAIVALASDRADLEARLGRVVVASTHEAKPVTARDLGASGAMTALLRDAIEPNLVQTREGGPALVHAGPFANIAHGCSSVVATQLAMRLGDYAITEAGFGFDLGGEKFLDIKCRAAGVWPRAVVLVVTLRALRAHGGIDHLDKHLETVASFGLPVVVALNVFAGDPPDAVDALARAMTSRGIPFAANDGHERGGEGALGLARIVGDVVDATDSAPPAPRFLYGLDEPPEAKARAIARTVYGARDVVFTARARADLARCVAQGGDRLPLCFAKTHLSLSDDPHALGRPRDFDVTVREVRLAAGAGMLVALTGEITTMPGLPREPAARRIHLDEDGVIVGLGADDEHG
jgi:formate--tetrahydrofolate ligase